MKQRTLEWQQIRQGRITASEIHKILAPKGLGKTGETYLFEKVAEAFTGETQEVKTPAMEWGIELEPFGKGYFESARNIKLTDIGFIEFGKYAGCSPDGYIEAENAGFELKCPFNSENHIKNLLLENQAQFKAERPEYYWQVMSSLMFTRWDKWYFASFDPRFTGKNRMKVLEIIPDYQDFEFIADRLSHAVEFIEKVTNLLQS